jgi:MT0933-like antitoxin protein
MGMMDDIEKLAQKARDLAEEHPDQVRKVLDQAEHQLDARTGGKHTGQIDSVGDKVADFLTPDPPKDAPAQ